MIIFGGGAGALIKLRCPKCGEVQARARLTKGAMYECRKCGESFTHERGHIADGESHSVRRKR